MSVRRLPSAVQSERYNLAMKERALLMGECENMRKLLRDALPYIEKEMGSADTRTSCEACELTILIRDIVA